MMSFVRAGEALARRKRSPYVQAICTHDGFHGIRSRYDRHLGVLTFLLACEDCGAELRQLRREPYWPRYDPNGNGCYLPERASSPQPLARSSELGIY
jgi:hypothetical protein